MSRWLEANGYVTKTAFDGEEALSIALAFRPHAAVLDVMMPKKNGCSLARALKEFRPSRNGVDAPKILLMTGAYGDAHPMTHGMLGHFSMADDVLYKPFRMRDLLVTLRGLLNG